MLQNGVVQISTAKLAGITLLPTSVLLLSGLFLWRYWRGKQVKLRAETEQLNEEIQEIRDQMASWQYETASKSSASSASKPSRHSEKQPGESDPERMGLFDYLIHENINLRKQ